MTTRMDLEGDSGDSLFKPTFIDPPNNFSNASNSGTTTHVFGHKLNPIEYSWNRHTDVLPDAVVERIEEIINSEILALKQIKSYDNGKDPKLTKELEDYIAYGELSQSSFKSQLTELDDEITQASTLVVAAQARTDLPPEEFDKGLDTLNQGIIAKSNAIRTNVSDRIYNLNQALSVFMNNPVFLNNPQFIQNVTNINVYDYGSSNEVLEAISRFLQFQAAHTIEAGRQNEILRQETSQLVNINVDLLRTMGAHVGNSLTEFDIRQSRTIGTIAQGIAMLEHNADKAIIGIGDRFDIAKDELVKEAKVYKEELEAASSSLKTNVKNISGGLGQLENIFTKEREELVTTFDRNVKAIENSLAKLDNVKVLEENFIEGVKDYNTAASNFNTGGESFREGAVKYAVGAESFTKGGTSFSEGAKAYKEGARTLSDTTKAFSDSARSFERGGTNFIDGASKITTASTNITAAGDTFRKGATSFQSGSEKYLEGAKEYSKGARTNTENALRFETGGKDFSTGAADYKSGGDSFVKGGESFDKAAKLFQEDAKLFSQDASKIVTGVNNVETALSTQATSLETFTTTVKDLVSKFEERKELFEEVQETARSAEAKTRLATDFTSLENKVRKELENVVSAIKTSSTDQTTNISNLDSRVKALETIPNLLTANTTSVDTLKKALDTLGENVKSIRTDLDGYVKRIEAYVPKDAVAINASLVNMNERLLELERMDTTPTDFVEANQALSKVDDFNNSFENFKRALNESGILIPTEEFKAMRQEITLLASNMVDLKSIKEHLDANINERTKNIVAEAVGQIREKIRLEGNSSDIVSVDRKVQEWEARINNLLNRQVPPSSEIVDILKELQDLASKLRVPAAREDVDYTNQATTFREQMAANNAQIIEELKTFLSTTPMDLGGENTQEQILTKDGVMYKILDELKSTSYQLSALNLAFLSITEPKETVSRQEDEYIEDMEVETSPRLKERVRPKPIIEDVVESTIVEPKRQRREQPRQEQPRVLVANEESRPPVNIEPSCTPRFQDDRVAKLRRMKQFNQTDNSLTDLLLRNVLNNNPPIFVKEAFVNAFNQPLVIGVPIDEEVDKAELKLINTRLSPGNYVLEIDANNICNLILVELHDYLALKAVYPPGSVYIPSTRQLLINGLVEMETSQPSRVVISSNGIIGNNTTSVVNLDKFTCSTCQESFTHHELLRLHCNNSHVSNSVVINWTKLNYKLF